MIGQVYEQLVKLSVKRSRWHGLDLTIISHIMMIVRIIHNCHINIIQINHIIRIKHFIAHNFIQLIYI